MIFRAVFKPPEQSSARETPLQYAENPSQLNSIITPAQIEQLNSLRNRTDFIDTQQYPLFRISGRSLPNIVPEAGIFTAKINRDNEIQNVVIMLSSVKAVCDFQQLYYKFRHLASQDFWAEGYLLPSRTGACHWVLWVTDLRYNGVRILP